MTGFLDQVDNFLDADKYRGLMVDFEAFPKKGQAGFLSLLNELSTQLHAKGMKLYVSVPSHNDEWNYAAVAAASDGVVLMNYDEHYGGGTPGPVASQDWFVDNLKLRPKGDSQRQAHLRHCQFWIRLGSENRSTGSCLQVRRIRINRFKMPG